MNDNRISLNAAARLVGVNRATMLTRINNGTLPYTRNDDGSYLVDPDDVREVMSHLATAKHPQTRRNLAAMDRIVALVETTDRPLSDLLAEVGMVTSIPASWRSGKNRNPLTRQAVERLDAAMSARDARQEKARHDTEQSWLDAVEKYGGVKAACEATGVRRDWIYNARTQADKARAEWFRAELARRLDKVKAAEHAERQADRAARAAARPKLMRGPAFGRVYVIGEEGGGPVKIGYTAYNPERRARELATGNAKKLVVLASGAGTIQTERAIHAIMQPFRLEGEWFDPSPPIRTLIRAMRQRGAGCPIDAEFLEEVRRMVQSYAQPVTTGGLFGPSHPTQ